jgi:predicted nucleic acid-binding Zn ribbon protein
MGREFTSDKYKIWKKNSKKTFKNSKNLNLGNEDRDRLEDPTSISTILTEFNSHPEWKKQLAKNTLFHNWEEIVGKEIGEHSKPITILDGVLTIQTSSTAWAVQLNTLQTQLLQNIQKSSDGALITALKIIPPKSRSWKKGALSARDGRGPRDTYI